MGLSDAQKRANSRLTFLDLCSGLGGASQPALDRGWRVIRVDIDPHFKPDIVADVRALPLRPFHVDVLWASPPCTEFTKASLPQSWANTWKNPPNIEAGMILVRAAIASVDLVKPSFWLLENVLGSRKFIEPILGRASAIVPGHAFWGNLAWRCPKTKGHKWRLPPSPERTALRAKIPYSIGEAICRAVEQRQAMDPVGL